MPEQKFHKGDVVRIRPFEEIDTGDIGNITHAPDSCYSIRRETIDKMSKLGPFVVVSGCAAYGTYVYEIKYHDSGSSADYYWAQGMLEFEAAEELPEPPAGLLFELLFNAEV